MKSIINRIIIDPRCRINYSSFYIDGLRTLFGSRIVEFQCFPELSVEISNCMAVKVLTN